MRHERSRRDSRRQSRGAGGTDAQREARRPGAGGRGLLTGSNIHRVRRSLTRMRFIIMQRTRRALGVGRDTGPGVDRACRELSASWRRRGCSSAQKACAPARRGAAAVCRRHPQRHRRSFRRRQGSWPPASASCVRARSRTRSSGRRGSECSATWRSTSAPSPSPGTSAWCGAGERQHAPLHGPAQGDPLDGGWGGAVSASSGLRSRV